MSEVNLQSVDLNGTGGAEKTSSAGAVAKEEGRSTAETSPAPQNDDIGGGHGGDEPKTEVSASCDTSLRHVYIHMCRYSLFKVVF